MKNTLNGIKTAKPQILRMGHLMKGPYLESETGHFTKPSNLFHFYVGVFHKMLPAESVSEWCHETACFKWL